jgi:hypothetical protein
VAVDPALWPSFERVRAALAILDLPEIEESTWYHTPSLKVRARSLLRVKDPETLVLICPLPDKELLMEAAPAIYFETPHYHGYPAVLVRIAAISEAELAKAIERAWRMQVPKRLLAAYDAARKPAGLGAVEGRQSPALFASTGVRPIVNHARSSLSPARIRTIPKSSFRTATDTAPAAKPPKPAPAIEPSPIGNAMLRNAARLGSAPSEQHCFARGQAT